MDEKGTGTCVVSYDLIAQAMSFPEGTEIVRIEQMMSNPNTCIFVVKHTDLPTDRDASLRPQFRTINQSVVEFDGWGIEAEEDRPPQTNIKHTGRVEDCELCNVSST